MQDDYQFETLLAELSATFVNPAAAQVDAQIHVALRDLVEVLGLDRAALAELVPDREQLVIAHSCQKPGVPAHSPMILEQHLPWYAQAAHRGEVLRLCSLPVEQGTNVARQLLEQYPTLRLVALTRHDEPAPVGHLAQVGIAGIVLKRTAARDLLPAIDEELRSGTFIRPALRASVST